MGISRGAASATLTAARRNLEEALGEAILDESAPTLANQRAESRFSPVPTGSDEPQAVIDG